MSRSDVTKSPATGAVKQFAVIIKGISYSCVRVQAVIHSQTGLRKALIRQNGNCTAIVCTANKSHDYCSQNFLEDE